MEIENVFHRLFLFGAFLIERKINIEVHVHYYGYFSFNIRL